MSIETLAELRNKPTGREGGHCCKGGLVGRGSTEGRRRGGGEMVAVCWGLHRASHEC